MKAPLTLYLFLLIGTGSAIFSQTVTIGTQVWMTKNLDVATFRNGDPIPEAKTAEEWEKAGENQQPAWCYYNNDPANGAKYGKLYNWYAVNDSRGLAPVGYHIPSDAEWTILTTFLGGESVAGTKMKSTGGWAEYGNGTNISGFSGLPGGNRFSNGNFYGMGYDGYWWSRTEDGTFISFNHYLNLDVGEPVSYTLNEEGGLSVRCLRDCMGTGSAIFSQTVTIGTQVWMTKNLDVVTFRNGDPIPEAKTNEEWEKAGKNQQPAWCYYDNDTANGTKYGKLYNWYAVNDSRGLAPVGYHIPSDAEWTILNTFLGGESVAGTKMKSTCGWTENGNGTNESGFSGLPGGFCVNDGSFGYVGTDGYWWSSTEYGTGYAWNRYLYYDVGVVYRGSRNKRDGFSVRCLRD